MLLRILPRWWLQKLYLCAGTDFGEAVSYAFMGECLGFNDMLEDWEELECEYARRGYRTVPFEDFVNYGGHDIPLPNIGILRDPSEEPVLHAKLFRLRTQS